MSAEEARSAFVFSKGHYYKVIWFAQGADRNLMGAVFREPGADSWTLLYRFRYLNVPEGASTWYEYRGNDPDKMVAFFDHAIEQAARLSGIQFTSRDRLIVECDGNTAVSEYLLKQNWFHVIPNVQGVGQA